MKKLILSAALLMGAGLQAGYYKVAKDANGRWNWISPEGRIFLSKGCGVVNPKDSAVKPGAPGYDVLPKYKGDKTAWAKAATARLKRYGFNSIGAWSDEPMYGQGLAFAHTLALAGYDAERLVGAWSAGFRKKIQDKALAETAKLKNETRLLGYFLDNELPWYGDTGWAGPHNTPLISKYMALPAGSEDKRQAVAALRAYYKEDLAALAQATGLKAKSWAAVERLAPARGSIEFASKLQAAFAGQVAEQYFKVCRQAVLAADPNHLILGVRFAGSAPDLVAAACGRHCDVVSVNQYAKSGDADLASLDRFHVLAGGRPILLTEFSYRAMENRSGDLNRRGADVTVPTQADRAEHLTRFLEGVLSLPYIIGYHWFQYADESPQGRTFDDEDSNYGLVDIHDGEYEELRAAFVALNRRAEGLHAASSHVVPADAAASREPRLRRIGAVTAGLAKRKAWLNFVRDSREKVVYWNEPSAKGSYDVSGGRLKFDFDSGNDWGLGLGLMPTSGENRDGSASGLGYEVVELRARMTQGKAFWVFMGESGIGAPGAKDYNGVGDADGEAWESRPLKGSGKWETYRLRLEEFQPRTAWGNQHGNRVIDIQSAKEFNLYVGGKQGSGSLEAEFLEFAR